MGFIQDLAARAFGSPKEGEGLPSGDRRPEREKTANDQTPDEQNLAAFVKKKVEEVRSSASRISHEGIWMTNIAYLLGYDSVYYDTNLKQYRPVAGPFRPYSRNRVRSNQILSATQNRCARLCKNLPRWEVRPEDEGPQSRDQASLSMDVLVDMWERFHINQKRIDVQMWKQECGHSYFKVCYDDMLGEPMIDPTTEKFIGFEGDIRVDVATAFEVFPDPLAMSFDELRWLVHAKARKLDYFRDHYPERGYMVKEEDAWLLSTQYELRINTLNNIGPNASGTNLQMKNSAIELAYYERRTKKYPNGRMIIVANGVVLKDDELPVGEIPFAKFDDIKIGGKYYSETPITHARPLQDQYNRNLSKTSDHVNKLLAGKYIAAKGHGLAQESLNDRNGEIIEYNHIPGAKEPAAVQMPTIPEHVYKERETTKSELFEMFGLGDVSRGILPSAGIPAVGMQLLVDQDETRIGIEVEADEYAYARLGTLLLKYAGKYYKRPRRLKKKQNGEYRIREYTGQDLPAKPDVLVVRGSTAPTSRSLRRQEIMNAWQQGLLGNPQDPAVIQKVNGMMENGDNQDLWRDYNLDMGTIQRAITAIEEEQIPEVNKLNNPVLFVQELNRFRKAKETSLTERQTELLEATIDAYTQIGTDYMNPQMATERENLEAGNMADGTDPEAQAQLDQLQMESMAQASAEMQPEQTAPPAAVA